MRERCALVLLAAVIVAAPVFGGFCPVSGSLYVDAYASTNGGSYNDSDSMPISVVDGGFVDTMVSSTGYVESSGGDDWGGGEEFPPETLDEEVLADAMSHSHLLLRDDGFMVCGTGHGGIFGGAGNASGTSSASFMFTLTESTVCMVSGDTSWDYMSGSGSGNAWVYLRNGMNENLFALNSQSGHGQTELTLPAGTYTVSAYANSSSEALMYCEAMTWVSTSSYTMDLRVMSVPEPATIAILGFGMIAVLKTKR